MTLILTLLVLAVHETRPALLEIHQEGPEVYRVLWKAPALGDLRLSIRPRFPEGATPTSEPVAWSTGEFYCERYGLRCPGGLVGRAIRIDGLEATLTDVLVRITRADGGVSTALLKPASPSFIVPARDTAWGIVAVYTGLGVEHILLGIDHLLFVLGLLLLVKGTRRLLATVTAFTAAHSLTLAAATLGWGRLPPGPVEAVIALSIVFVAVEVARSREGRPGMAERRPWIVAFAFGLLHGFGFAGALGKVGLPEGAIAPALLFFNAGVELGQLLFIGAALGMAAALRRMPRPAWAWRVPTYAIGGLAAFWTIERVLAL